jgi:hypothetical protein
MTPALLATYPSLAAPGQELRLLHSGRRYVIERRGRLSPSGRRWRLDAVELKHPWTAYEHYCYARKCGSVLRAFPEEVGS